jgi:DNA-directed RNA polymerase subunit RPC12/RpoP
VKFAKALAEQLGSWDMGDGEYNPEHSGLTGDYADIKDKRERWCGNCGTKMVPTLKGYKCPKCKKIIEAIEHPCPDCGSKMKKTKFGGYKCPECGYEQSSEPVEYKPQWYPDYALGYESGREE